MGVKLQDLVNRIPIKDDMGAFRDIYNMSQGEGGLKTGAINWLLGRMLIPLNKSFANQGYRPTPSIPRSPSGILGLIRAAQKMPNYPNLHLDTSAVTPVEGWKTPAVPPSYNTVLKMFERDDD